jgi:uncharacterized membrane protein YGL010W
MAIAFKRRPHFAAYNHAINPVTLALLVRHPFWSQTMKPSATPDATATTEREVDRLLAIYSESHRHPTNEIIHFVCVPVIVFTVLGLFWSLHPLLALAVCMVAMTYYTRLSPMFALGMLAMSAAMLGILHLLPPASILPVAGTVFVLAWIGQFIGHKIEGKKPSFFDDLRFLLIGPLFVLSFLYRRLNLAW